MAKPRAGWAIAFFGVLALLFVAALAVGLHSGEMRVPAARFSVRLQRATNPIGFYMATALYAALVGLASYPLWLMLRRGRDSARPRTATSSGNGGDGRPILDLEGRVSVRSDGRCGQLDVGLGGTHHAFWWEFGGGDCIAIVTVPTADEWTSLPGLASYPRATVLEALAREVVRLQCPGARYEIEKQAILIRN